MIVEAEQLKKIRQISSVKQKAGIEKVLKNLKNTKSPTNLQTVVKFLRTAALDTPANKIDENNKFLDATEELFVKNENKNSIKLTPKRQQPLLFTLLNGFL